MCEFRCRSLSQTFVNATDGMPQLTFYAGPIPYRECKGRRTMKSHFLAAALMASSAFAQEPVAQFPEGAASITAEALTAAMGDKTFVAQPAKGPAWRLQYNANGYFFVNVGNFADSGKWSVKDSTVCTEGRQIRYFCNEFQSKDGVLYMKRENGEVLKLVPR
jgi:hypothetical protein